ncbi:hypothetical protein PWT90_09704 [Aphanocladium album]|nr:hypothetical protein PWT90_09704 [Aphanocladium album]
MHGFAAGVVLLVYAAFTIHGDRQRQAVHNHDPLGSRWKRKLCENAENKTLATNGDITKFSTKDGLVDLFHFMKSGLHPRVLAGCLDQVWKQDPLATLKIIFNARSIHLGKSARKPFYMAAGWLTQNYPHTLAANLPCLCRPVIEKKKALEAEEDMGIIDVEKAADDPSRFDVIYEMSHGYWKDLLNILALAVNGKLDGVSDPVDVLNGRVAKKTVTRDRNRSAKGSADQSKLGKKGVREQRHATAVKVFGSNPFYKALHLTVGRLFAEQLQLDTQALRHDDAKAAR